MANVLSIKRKKHRQPTESSFQDDQDDLERDSRKSIKSAVETSFIISEHEYVTKVTSNSSEHSSVAKTTSRSNSHSAVAKMISYVKEITGNTGEIYEKASTANKNPIFIESDEEDDKTLLSRNSKRKSKGNNRVDGENSDM